MAIIIIYKCKRCREEIRREKEEKKHQCRDGKYGEIEKVKEIEDEEEWN